RPFDPALSYGEWDWQSRYWRQVNCRLALDLSAQWRNQDYSIAPAASNLRYNGQRAQFSYNAGKTWNYSAGWQRDDYAWADPVLANSSNVYTLGAGYQQGDQHSGLNWRHLAARYSGQPLIDYDKDDYDFDFGGSYCHIHWRGYAGYTRLRQDFPGNVNN